MVLIRRIRLFALLISGPAAAGVTHAEIGLVDDFEDDLIDVSTWSILDTPGDGVTIKQRDGQLQWSYAGNPDGPGVAAIYSRDWAIPTDEDFRITVDYSLTIGNPGATRTGLNIALFTGDEASFAEADNRLDVSITKLGAIFFTESFFIAGGEQIGSGFSQTNANVDELTIYYNAAADVLTVSSDESMSSDPVAAVFTDVVGRTGADRFRLYLGGFVNGITIAVDGSDAFFDDLQVDACLVDSDVPPVGEPVFLDARDDADWFRRGTAADDRFGWSVAYAGDIDDDGISDVIVGSPRDDTGGVNAGSAAVFSGADDSKIFEVFGASPGDQLGFAVSAAGDWNDDGIDDVLVGVPRFDAGAKTNAGAVFVYSGDPPHAVLFTRKGQGAGDQFGYSVARAGDVDEDGIDDIIVGAPFNRAGGPKAGRAYVYLGDSGTLHARKTGQAPGGQFGRVVSGAGDIDVDGSDDFMVGAPFNSQNGLKAGKLVVYSGSTADRIFALLGDSPGDRLGWSAASLGDVTGDGHGDIVVGVINFDLGIGNNIGAALVVSGLTGSVHRIMIGQWPGARLGWAVTAVQDLDGDGRSEVAAAAPKHDFGGLNVGRVTIYSSIDGQRLFVIDGEAANNQFGTSVAGDPDASSPVAGLAVGAWRFRSGGQSNRGSAYRYDFTPPE